MNKEHKVKGGGSPGDRSKKTAKNLLALVVIGMGGIHRFYLGYYIIGVLQLLTLGGFFIWAIIDLRRINADELTPKNGDYTD